MITTTHTGMPIEELDQAAQEFLVTARHPKYKKKFTETIYQPMLELLEYLRANGFETYICSGGGVDFMRVFSEATYGIVPENVIGSFAMNKFAQVDGQWTIVKDGKNLFVNDGLTKPAGIDQLNDSSTNPLPNFQLLISHDDDTREYSYSEKDNASLNAAKQFGWHVVSMKNDWKVIFRFDE